MTSIQSLPPPPTEMLKEANKEQAEYMKDMLRIALGIKEFRIHAKPILSQKLAETPYCKIMKPIIKKTFEQLKLWETRKNRHGREENLFISGDTNLHWKKLKSCLFNEGNPYRNLNNYNIKVKFEGKILGEFYKLYNTDTGKRIKWRKTICSSLISSYYNNKEQLKNNKVSLEKMCALGIAYILIRKTQRWEVLCIDEIKRLINRQKIVLDYCLKHSPKNIIKNRRSLYGIHDFWLEVQ